MRNVLILLLITIGVFQSCSDSSIIENQSNKAIGLTTFDIEFIGKKHNEWLDVISKNLERYNSKLEIKYLDSELLKLNNGLNDEYKKWSANSYIKAHKNNYDIMKIQNNHQVKIAFDDLNQILTSSASIQELDFKLSKFDKKIKSQFEGLEQEALLVGSKVCSYSAKYWKTESTINGLELRWDWRKVTRNDLAGATWAVFELGGAMVLGATPGTNIAIGGAIASAAVGGSIMGAFFD
jgi:hypothetical protein